MKVYIEPAEGNDRAVKRVIGAFARYSPDEVEFVRKVRDAELVIMQVNGRMHRTTKRIRGFQRDGIRYAIIQYCLKSTRNKEAWEWIHIWEDAERIWSYYDLPTIAVEDGCMYRKNFPDNFYHAPLGVDATVFKPRYRDIQYTILNTGRNYLSESIREVYIATRQLKMEMAHLGENLHKPWINYFEDLSEDDMIDLYSSCLYVSGLRRNEGFELPAAEAFMCGTRPILYDKPHYRNWYGDFGEYIPETEREQIIKDIKFVLQQPYRPVTKFEIAKGREIFDWKTIIEGFWVWL